MGLVGQNPGAPGFAVPPDEQTQVRRMRDVERAIQEMFADGTLRALIDTLPATVTAALAAGISTTTVAASGAITGASANISGGVASVGVYNTDVSLLPGARQPMWQHSTGPMGFSPSTIRSKTNRSTRLPFTAADVRACMPYVFNYIGQLDIRDNPENPNYDPDYLVPLDIGFMAEHFIAHNLSCFVIFKEDGKTPATIDYAGFGAIANHVVLQDHEARLQAAGL